MDSRFEASSPPPGHRAASEAGSSAPEGDPEARSPRPDAPGAGSPPGRPGTPRDRSPALQNGSGSERPSLVLWGSLFYGALAAVALGWNAWAGTPWAFVDGKAEQAGVRWGRDAAIGLVTAAGMIAASNRVTTKWAWGERLARELGRAIGPLTWPAALWLAAVSGFAEEAFFRGALQPRLGWLGATLLFGLAHVPPNRALLPWTGFALLAGGLLGALYALTGNLLAPVLAHAGINAINLRLLSARYGGAPLS